METSSLLDPARRVGLLRAALIAGLIGIASTHDVATAACWLPPVDGTVTDPFRPPACRWCPGNRGIEYRTTDPAEVLSATPGSVSFAGLVVGTLYVVVAMPNGWRLTYGRLASTHLQTGDLVLTGSQIGHTAGELFFGLRVGDTYIDPAPHLGRLVGVPRLIPLDGSPPRPSPPALLQCRPTVTGTAQVNARLVGLQRL